VPARLTGPGAAAVPGAFKTYLAELADDGAADGVMPGDVATWRLPPAEVDERGIVHTPACDDLAAVAAALSAFDTLRSAAAADRGLAARFEDVRLLFTRAEEIGFVGAIAACKLGTLPRNARVIALENSRASAEAPVGGGPIVRVGDRMSVFSPRLTAACAKRAEDSTGRPAAPTATQKNSAAGGWQRKLMAGGACEATVFCAYGHEATCLCLPLGNYHNMADLDAVQAGTQNAARLGPPRTAREYIAASDYDGLVDLLVACGTGLPDSDAMLPRIESLHARYGFVLGER
jgi:endoglucanase